MEINSKYEQFTHRRLCRGGGRTICAAQSAPREQFEPDAPHNQNSVRIESGSFTIIFVNFRLLLWDCDDRSYSYYVEVSIHQQRWTRVADKSQEACKSWQYLQFDPLPVAFVRIIGTHNTANEVRAFAERGPVRSYFLFFNEKPLSVQIFWGTNLLHLSSQCLYVEPRMYNHNTNMTLFRK